MKTRPGRSGRPQGSNALPGFLAFSHSSINLFGFTRYGEERFTCPNDGWISGCVSSLAWRSQTPNVPDAVP